MEESEKARVGGDGKAAMEDGGKTGAGEGGKEALAARAKKYEGRQLFVKAAEYYLEAEMEGEAAAAYEKGGAYIKAEELFEKLGRMEDAARCKKLREETTNQPTWADLQAEFQADRGNPD